MVHPVDVEHHRLVVCTGQAVGPVEVFQRAGDFEPFLHVAAEPGEGFDRLRTLGHVALHLSFLNVDQHLEFAFLVGNNKSLGVCEGDESRDVRL